MRSQYHRLVAALAVVSCTPPAAAPTPTPAVPAPAAAAPTTTPAVPAPAVAKECNGCFDRASAAHAIGTAPYVTCRDPQGPFGDGHITLTFQPDGSVSTAELDAGPFAGTPTGTCLEQTFRVVQMRPFDGAPVKVGKALVIR